MIFDRFAEIVSLFIFCNIFIYVTLYYYHYIYENVIRRRSFSRGTTHAVWRVDRNLPRCGSRTMYRMCVYTCILYLYDIQGDIRVPLWETYYCSSHSIIRSSCVQTRVMFRILIIINRGTHDRVVGGCKTVQLVERSVVLQNIVDNITHCP